MLLIQLLNKIKEICSVQKNIRFVSAEDVYEAMSRPDVDYGAIILNQTGYSYDSESGLNTLSLRLFYIDRLTDNEDNKLTLFNTSFEVLKECIKNINKVGVNVEKIVNFQPFTQKFKDYCAGSYVTFTVEFYEDWLCEDDGFIPMEIDADAYDVIASLEAQIQQQMSEIQSLEEQMIKLYEECSSGGIVVELTSNGEYFPADFGASSFTGVVVDVDFSDSELYDVAYQEGYNEGYEKGDAEGYNEGHTDGYGQGYTQGQEEVINNAERIAIESNGFYGDGSTLYKEIEVSVLPNLQEKSEVLTGNGEITISADEGYDGLSSVNVTVNYTGKPIIPNGTTLMGSTMEAINMSDYDWSMVYDWFEYFYSCKSLTSLGTEPFYSKPLNLGYMFYDCYALSDISALSNWDTRYVTDMSYMFENCESLSTLTGLENWGVYSVTNMERVFYNCKSLTDISALSNWNTSDVTNMYGMFYNSKLSTLTGLENWDVSSVTDMSNMFQRCTYLTDISALSNWNVSNVDMSNMFTYCSSLSDISVLSNWDTSFVTDMFGIFSNCHSLTTADLSNWNISNVMYMNYMFNICSSLTEVRFGGDCNPSVECDSMFDGIETTGTLYYPASYADNYVNIIASIPSTWTAVAY